MSPLEGLLDHPPLQLLDNGEGIVLDGGGPIQDEPEADNEPGRTVSIGAPIRANRNILVFDDIVYCHQYQSQLSSLFVCIVAYTIQLFRYNSCCSYRLLYFYLICLNSSMCNRITLLTSFIFRCLHNSWSKISKTNFT
jgi:hypothetical protein